MDLLCINTSHFSETVMDLLCVNTSHFSETVMEDNNPVLFILVRQQWIYYVSIPHTLVRQ